MRTRSLRTMAAVWLVGLLLLLNTQASAAPASRPDAYEAGGERVSVSPGAAQPFIARAGAFVYLPVVLNEMPSRARNDSYPTPCAEEDNVNVPLFARAAERWRITATHPAYAIGTDNCATDFSGCSATPGGASGLRDSCTKMYDDGTTIVEGCTMPSWWRPYRMTIRVGEASGDYHYLRLYRQVEGERSWPQFLVLYQDGYLRLIPHPPVGRTSVCFGSSVIVGPALPSTRPYVDLREVTVAPAALALDLAYRAGGTAHVALAVDRTQAAATVDVHYPYGPTAPLAIFRSMYVADGNADVDHIQNPLGSYPILGTWRELPGPWWAFSRAAWSRHNTSAPDIRVDLLAPAAR